MLLRPLDFALLDELTEGRNVGANLHVLVDASSPYTLERLSQLADYGLVRRVGPNENVGLYEITPLGEAALAHRGEYGEVDDFEALIEDAVEK
ncbi:hypothetical protein DJ72_02845 [Halorubrum distributum]|nr:hypothetical protein DJ72_02845 [Halorubrum distributum]